MSDKRCNACGQNLPETTHLGHTDSHELKASRTIFPGDLTVLRAVVCSPCLQAWVRTFQVAPVVADRLAEMEAERLIAAADEMEAQLRRMLGYPG
jgi:hypothetical protein